MMLIILKTIAEMFAVATFLAAIALVSIAIGG
jgi:hypothetical protein